MLVTLPGIVMLVRAAQLWKAASPIVVTPLEISTLARRGHSWKAPDPMLVTLPGILMLPR